MESSRGKGDDRATGDDPSHTYPDLRFSYVSSGGLVHGGHESLPLLSVSLSRDTPNG